MSRPQFTVERYRDKFIKLYALKEQGNTIAQIELRKNQLIIYPLYKGILFIHKGKIKSRVA